MMLAVVQNWRRTKESVFPLSNGQTIIHIYTADSVAFPVSILNHSMRMCWGMDGPYLCIINTSINIVIVIITTGNWDSQWSTSISERHRTSACLAQRNAAKLCRLASNEKWKWDFLSPSFSFSSSSSSSSSSSLSLGQSRPTAGKA